MNYNYSDRIIQSTDELITGKSVVLEKNQNTSDIMPLNPWPYSLSDYLIGFIGKSINVKYKHSNGRYCEKQGELIVAGSNFIAIQPAFTEDLLIIQLDSIQSINVMNYIKRSSGNGGIY